MCALNDPTRLYANVEGAPADTHFKYFYVWGFSGYLFSRPIALVSGIHTKVDPVGTLVLIPCQRSVIIRNLRP
jgi:hypothetical protein